MGNLIKVIIFFLCINIMLYLGGFTVFEGDILSRFFTISGGSVTGLNESFSGSIPTTPLVAGIDASDNNFRITDIPKTIFSIFLFLLNIMLAPLAIFSAPQLDLPFAFKMMVGVPMALIMIFVVIDWWRGND